MLVSSVGYFNANTKSIADRAESIKNLTNPVVTRGLTIQDFDNKNSVSRFQNIKEAASEFLSIFSKDTSDMKNSLDMIV